MKHKPLFIILLMLAAALCLSVFALAAEGEPADETDEPAEPLSAQFEDLSYSENETVLAFMIDRGLVAGFTDGTFRPGRSYTRLELAQLVTELCALDTVSGYQSGFYDYSLSGAEAIDAAVSNGLMTGRSIQSFDPYGSVLKAEMIGTMEKAAAYLALDGFYDHASGSYTDWATDYTICTADEAMQCAYQLAQAMELKAEAEAQAAATEAAANAVAELTGAAEPEASEEMSSYDKMTASNEPAEAPAEPQTEPETEPESADETAAASAEPAADAAEPQASGEPTASGEASAEPAATQQQTQQESTPPAGVTTPASAAADPAAQPAQSAPVSEVPAASVPTETDEADGLRNEIKSIYFDVRDSIVTFLRDLFGV